MNLNDIKDNDGARNKYKRVGRGIGSGKGKTAARGTKGQKSRSGVSINGFEGGQMPIHRRLGKRGFKSLSRKDVRTISMGLIQESIDKNKLDVSQIITKQHLKDLLNISNSKSLLKILATGELKSRVNIEIDLCSSKALELISNLGGKVILANAA